MTKESERRKREGEEVGEVTDEESVELWLVEKNRKNTQSGSRGGIGPEMPPSSGADGRLCGPGDAQFVNAITVDLPSLTTMNQINTVVATQVSNFILFALHSQDKTDTRVMTKAGVPT